MKRFFVIDFLRGSYVCPPLICLKIKSFLLVSCLALCGFGDVGWVNGQDECGFDEQMESLFSTYPEYEEDFEDFKANWANHYLTKTNHDEENIFIIPTVVHILHDDGVEDGDGDIPDELVENAMERLNNDFRAITGTTGENGIDTRIEFRLANKDEHGDCTNGITHNNTPIRYSYDDTNMELIMKDQFRWNPFMYLNIYVVDCFANANVTSVNIPVNCATGLNVITGRPYAIKPHSSGLGSNVARYDGIVLDDSRFLSSAPQLSTVLTHEAGHYLGLFHTFAGDSCQEVLICQGENLPECCYNDEAPPCCSNYGDFCCDTNPCREIILGVGSFCSNPPNTGCLNLPYPVLNYMSYSGCRREFTNEQIELMHFSLNDSERPSRTFLWTNQNYTATGIAVASATEPIICNNESTTLSVTADNTADSIRWFVKDGDQTLPTIINKNTITVSPNMTTIYGVAVNEGVICGDDISIFDEDEITITVNPLPTLPYSNDNGISTYNRCDNDAITINLDNDFQETGVSNPNYSYEWYSNGTLITDEAGLIVSDNDPANYDVLITDNVTQCSNWQMVETPMVDGFSASLETIPSLPVYCEAVIINPLITPTNGAFIPQNYSYEWSTESKENRIAYLPEQSGTYTITVEITDMTTECTETLTQTINFQSGIPQPNLQESNNPFNLLEECGQKLRVINSNSFDTFRWYLNGEQISNQSGDSYIAKEKGTYYVIGVNTTIGCETKSENMPISHDDLKSHTITQDLLPTDQDINTTGTTTWMSGDGSMTNRIIDGYIEIEDGQKLVIQGQNTVLQFFDGNSGIKVRKGGILVIDEATLEASDCIGEWGGIIIYGDGFKAHPGYTDGGSSSNDSFIGSPDHGLVVLRNGATIQNARTAVSSTFSYDVLDNNGQAYNYGGGIVYADGANFVNNNTGILMGHFKAEGDNIQKSVIKKCVFTNSTLWENNGFFGNLGSTVQNSNKGYEQALIFNAGKGLKIYENQFKSTLTNSDYKERGVGLRIVGTPLTVGENENGDLIPNYFNNLYKGIDVYTPLNIKTVPNIVNNEFTNVFKGITLNTTPLSIVTGNTFIVPESDDPDDHSYGILTHQSFGFEITDNCFMTETEEINIDDNFTKGLIIKTSHFEDLIEDENNEEQEELQLSWIVENRFAGHFKAATQIEGDNRKMQLRCNNYDNEADSEITALRDWFLPEKSLEGSITQIERQGECSEEAENIGDLDPFANTWNQGDPTKLHVLNQMQTETGAIQSIFFTPDDNPNSIPEKLNDPNAIGLDDCFLQGLPVNIQVNCGVNASCVVELAPEGVGLPPFYYYPPPIPTSRPDENCAFYADRVRNWLYSGQYQSVLDMLHCQNTLGGNKLLAATYAIEGNHSITMDVLGKIPSTNYPNVEFKELVTAILGKQIPTIERIAGYTYSVNSAYAQSALATLKGKSYRRTSVREASSDGTAKRSTASTYKESISDFKMYPNPATHTLTIQLNTLSQTTNRSFSIYNMNGQLVETVVLSSAMTTLSIESLPTGIYYCHLADQAKVEKLVIVK